MGAGAGGLAPSLPSPLHPPLLIPATLPFSVQYRQCLQPSGGGVRDEGQGQGDCAFRKGKGSLCEGQWEDVLPTEAAPGLFTGFWESWAGSHCYCCWWDLKVLWCEPCRTGEGVQGEQGPPGMLPLAFRRPRSHHSLLRSCFPHADTLGRWGLETWGVTQRLRTYDFLPSQPERKSQL